MCPKKTFSELANPLSSDTRSPCEAEADEVVAPSISGCDVTEYDDSTGQQAWADSVFVQDFTDSVLGTAPGPLNFEIDPDR